MKAVVNQNFHTVFFQPVKHGAYIFTPSGYSNNPVPYTSTAYRINAYLYRGFAYVNRILKMLISSSPYIDQYGPMIRDLPKIYHIMKAFKEIQKNEQNELLPKENEKGPRDAPITPIENERIEIKRNDPLPVLFI